MAKKKKMERAKAIPKARKLFIKGFTFKEIHELVGYAPRTIEKWAKKLDWKKAKSVNEMTDESIKEIVMTAFNDIKEGRPPSLPIKEIRSLHTIYKELSLNKESFFTIIKVMNFFTDFVAKKHQAIKDKKEKTKHLDFMNLLSYEMEAFTTKYNKDHG